MTTTYVALLRGINVGGKNRILMAQLRAAFEAAGFTGVRTYIQSGNVVFGSDATDQTTLTRSIEELLTAGFDYRATATLRDHAEMQAIVDAAPPGFGREPDDYRYDVMFLLPPVTSDEALDALVIKEGIDAAWTGPDVVYSTRLIARASSSGLSKIASHPVYQRMTIRNWNTTTRLLSMMDEAR